MSTPAYRVTGATGDWEVVVGLEVHAQITSHAKLFSGASTEFGAEPNTQVSFVDAAMPGMLPVLNGECVKQAVRTGLALDAEIHRWSRFDRKNYFYADLPQGYQISQLYHPIVGEGELTVEVEGTKKAIGVERIHIEQDAGKLMHDQHPTMSYVDLNRCGVALMEIVSKPDMRSPAEAGAYVKKLREILRYVGSCDGNMEQGSMRADVNVSVRKRGPNGEETPFGTRTETKNVNSVRYIQAVVELEARRQVEVIEGGGTIEQETRLFDPDANGGKGGTRSMRSKEDAHDYRYFPDPDLLPLVLTEDFVAECRASLPELPDAKRTRYVETLGITPYNAEVIVADVETSRWFEALLAEGVEAKAGANWLTSELFGALNRMGRDIVSSPVSPPQAAELLKLVADGTLSGSMAKQVFEAMLKTGEGAAAIVEERGLKQTSDTGAIDTAITAILTANAEKVAQYRAGKEALFGFFVGQTMKAMAGKANPGVVNERLRAMLALYSQNRS